MDLDEIDDISVRMTTIDGLNRKKAPKADDFDHCCSVLRAGITATKYNFSNKAHRPIYLYLTKDGKHLEYQQREGKRSLKERIFGP